MVQPTLIWSYSPATEKHRQFFETKPIKIKIQQVNAMNGRLWNVSCAVLKEQSFSYLSKAIQFIKEKFPTYIHDTSQIEEDVKCITAQEQGSE